MGNPSRIQAHQTVTKHLVSPPTSGITSWNQDSAGNTLLAQTRCRRVQPQLSSVNGTQATPAPTEGSHTQGRNLKPFSSYLWQETACLLQFPSTCPWPVTDKTVTAPPSFLFPLALPKSPNPSRGRKEMETESHPSTLALGGFCDSTYSYVPVIIKGDRYPCGCWHGMQRPCCEEAQATWRYLTGSSCFGVNE